MTITPEDLKLHKKWLNDEPDGARLVRPSAVLHGAVLSGADLYGAVLTGADLYGAVLHGAILSGVDLSGAILHGVDLSGAILYGAVLTGADLSGAVLHGAELFCADLSRAVLHGADLSGSIGLTIAEDAADRLREVAVAALTSDDALEMDEWHSCGTSHCIAGWAIHQAGEAGRLLEKSMGAEVAGLMLLGIEAHSHFFDDNEKAREYLQSVLGGETND